MAACTTFNSASLRSILFCGSFMLGGCDAIIDLAIDCIDDDGPVLSPRALPSPILNQSYDVTVTASIENEPFDDAFRYDIRVSDTLPPGLTTEVFERRIKIFGAATELGPYTVAISVNVQDPFREDDPNSLSGTNSGLCRYNIERSYQLNVVEQ